MKQIAWHFTAEAGLLRDGSPFEVGVALPTIKGKINPCHRGYHGSPTVLDACNYAPGPHLYKRELSGTVKPHGEPLDKYAASEATATLYVGDVSPLLRVFACQCAADTFYLWKPPKVVREYILTQDESLRAAAWDAAWDAAQAAAQDAAQDAAWDAAQAAAWAAAQAAAWAAARDAARAAAWAAAWAAQRTRLDVWVERFIKDGTIPTVTIPERAAAKGASMVIAPNKSVSKKNTLRKAK